MTLILNLGCGTKTCAHENVINIDWSMYLRIAKSKFLMVLAKSALDEDRFVKLKSIPDNVILHDLSKGIPYADGVVDAVYHSHVLEHLDRNIASVFLAETIRVLKPGGVLRVVVPDLELLVREYIDHIKLCEIDSEAALHHDEYIARILEQCVRKEASSTSKQKTLRRFIENRVLGDARTRGETHQWMYDRFNLQSRMQSAGFSDTRAFHFNESWIDEWNVYGLDLDAGGGQYKRGSLYFEGRKAF